MPYKKIMLAIDQDDVSFYSLEHAIQLAKKVDASLKIIHVVDEIIISRLNNDPKWNDNFKVNEKVHEDFVGKLLSLAKTKGILPETQLITITRQNQHVAFEIADAAKNWSADLIIIGAYSRKGIHKLLLGHVAEGILRITDIPVLLIHQQPRKLSE